MLVLARIVNGFGDVYEVVQTPAGGFETRPYRVARGLHAHPPI